MLASPAKFGVVPESAPQQNLCLNDNYSSRCLAFLNQSGIKDYILGNCQGRQKCILNVTSIAIQYARVVPNDDCFGDSSFFVQLPCEIEEPEERQVQGLFVGCVGVFVALFFISYIDYMRSVFKSTAVEWDVKTITAGDYSVEIPISHTMWNTFLTRIYDKSDLRPKLEQFRTYFEREMSHRLSSLPDLGFEDEPPERINIALITFAFDNAEVINLLKARGAAIKFEKFDKMRAINAQIEQTKNENMEKLERPVSAFLTFENEEGLNRCINYNETV